ncbi:MAG TPA: lyase [Woeseiaceae bacterium]|nr:lyase [Woeseiaceae bacterium]
MHTATRILALTAVLLATAGTVAEPSQGAPLDIREWRVPWEESRPRDPYAESADSVWFVGQRAGYLAHFDVATGEFSKVDLKDGSGPHNLIVGEDGVVWYAGNRHALIGRYDPASGEIEEIVMPDPAARDPHTLVFDGSQETIWFTVQGGNRLGRLDIASRGVELIEARTEGARPYGIKIGPDGAVWAVLFGTNRLARIDPESLEHEEIELPREGARPRRLEVLPDGRVWYVDYAEGRLGAYDPGDGTFEEWPLPQGEDARPYGMAADAAGMLWMVATGVQPNVFLGFDPDTEEFVHATEIPSGGGTIRHMHYHEPSGTVWFGTDTNFLGRAVVEPAKAGGEPAPAGSAD